MGRKGRCGRVTRCNTGYREWNWEPNRPYIQRLMHFHAALMWCYIYWSFRHNWRELVGENIWPQRSEWSDQYLGVPQDEDI
ncbi:unnamed protein product [Oppiella nova]|uniref:Uncharacterized protein n=1 Tax=Oppiella nova TaxID=334625 RepID=A0A7R9MEQ2_9ACAR|nr:unnamed protein product [Oppiella nova]CAG2176016.1 unnamed protein product [Oppiella nova]